MIPATQADSSSDTKKKILKRLDIIKTIINLKSIFYEDKEM